jgi:anti-sigma-K factor RskA
MAFFGGPTQNVISESLQQPLGTVKARIRPGMPKLRGLPAKANMIDERKAEQASLYTLGALPPEEVAEFEQALRVDVELQQLVRELQAAADSLTRSVPRVPPPAHLQQEVFQRLDNDQRIVPMPATSWPALLPWAIAACLAVGVMIMWGQGHRLERQTALLRNQLEEVNRRAGEVRGRAETFQRQLATFEQELTTLRSKDALSEIKIAFLGSLLESTPKAVAVSLWDKDRQGGVLIVRDLAPLPADQEYQFWVIEDKNPNPVNAGVFSVDARGAVRYNFKPARDIRAADKFAISIERKGGPLSAPQGQVVMAGN